MTEEVKKKGDILPRLNSASFTASLKLPTRSQNSRIAGLKWRESKGFAGSVFISNSTPGSATKPGPDSMRGIIFKPVRPDTYFTGIYSRPTR